MESFLCQIIKNMKSRLCILTIAGERYIIYKYGIVAFCGLTERRLRV